MTTKMHSATICGSLWLALLTIPTLATAADMYIDPGLGSSCASYDVATRMCGNGQSRAFVMVNEGLASVNAGDTLLLRDGSYGMLNVQRSGTPAAPINIRGFDGESAVVSTGGGNIGIRVVGQTNISFANLIVTDVAGFGRIENSSRIRFDAIQFSNASASGTTGALKFVRSTHNRIQNSAFVNGSDLLLLQDASDFNLVEGNTFGDATHSQISIRCSSRNVIRSNHFDNSLQKAMEMYDCEGVSDAPVRLDDAKRNVLERNRFLGTRASDASHRYNAIQQGAQQSIIRRNVFAFNLGGGVNFTYYSDESLNDYENRLFNNTFYDNRCFGIIGSSGPANRYFDNRVVNNLLYLNRNCAGGGGQVSIPDASSVILSNNSLEDNNPGFANIGSSDFSLTGNSAQIDAGAFVAVASSDGSGTALVVDDAGWFYDGFGIEGETGDLIRIEGQNVPVRITAINYATNTITLSAGANWSSGDGVNLNYVGAAPDVGAFEFGLSDERTPNPPTNLTAE